MGNSKLVYHVVLYAVNERQQLVPLFDDAVVNCITDCILNAGEVVIESGGPVQPGKTREHCHLLIETRPFTSVGELLEKIRLPILRWIRQQPQPVTKGYGVTEDSDPKQLDPENSEGKKCDGITCDEIARPPEEVEPDKCELHAGFFTVSFSMMDRVQRFIQDQERHHETISFEEEYVALLDRHAIRFEEDELWQESKNPAGAESNRSNARSA